ncbi:MAG TPA: hypothetical protein VF396_26820, partial [Bradyrhizobium sp.]
QGRFEARTGGTKAKTNPRTGITKAYHPFADRRITLRQSAQRARRDIVIMCAARVVAAQS